jgi:broad specificity phosphatase PhoE
LFLGAEADIGLSERGLRGAKEITPTLALHFPAAITRSPMRRALETPPPSVQARNAPSFSPLKKGAPPEWHVL